MDSDDSDAAEVASEADEYEESFVADEIEDEVDEPVRRAAIITTTTTTTASHARTASTLSPGPAFSSAKQTPTALASLSIDEGSNPYADDDYEADDAYSVDFEDADDGADTKTKRLPPQSSQASSPVGRSSPAKRPPATIAEDAEYAYSEASFEDESRVSQSQSMSTNRLVVDLSVPVRRDSNGSSGGGGGSSPMAKTHTNPRNSPNINLKVLSKPSPVAPSSPGGGARHLAAPSYATHLHHTRAAPVVVTPDLALLLEAESDKSLSLLLRKVESKYQDELESLREKNALLAWKERELKTELRLLKDERKMRKSHLDKKRKRALERRRETELSVEKLRTEAAELSEKGHSAKLKHEQLETTIESLRKLVTQSESERRDVETRNMALTEKLQTTLSDFHALNLKYEAAVSARLEAERRTEEQGSKFAMERHVLEHKTKIEVDAVLKTLELEREGWKSERQTLPEIHHVMVENEKQRLEKLETQLNQRVREMETQVVKESVRFERELSLAWEAKRSAEERAEKRLQEELTKIARERDALDEQRRELLMGMTKSSSRTDEERGRLDATREQLEVRRLKLVEERAELDAKAAYVEDRVHRLAQEENVLEARKHELTKLGRETFEKSKLMAQRMHAFTEMQRELATLRAAQEQLLAQAQASEEHKAQLEREKVAVENTARQLQHERLMVAKQRMQSRHFLDGAKKLELLLQQQKALEHVRGPTTTSS